MLRGFRAQALALSLGLWSGCDEGEELADPAPLPVVPAASALTDDGAPGKSPRSASRKPKTKERAKSGTAKTAPHDQARDANEPNAAASTTRPTTSTAPASKPGAPKTSADKPKLRVVVPHTEHVHADISDALQADLDADPRMQAWLEKAMAVIDGCHAKSRDAVGTIQGTLTMHESARPTFVLGSISPQLGGVVGCSTAQLVRIKMPLFTGREGARHTVRVNFE